MFVSAGLRYKSMLSAAIHYATLNSFRSIKLPSSLYKPPVLMLGPPLPPLQPPFEQGNSLTGLSVRAAQGALLILLSHCQMNCGG